MMKEILTNDERVRGIESPYANLQKQIDTDDKVFDMLWTTKGIFAFDLWVMMPKVTYDDWIVCHYLRDNKLYYITHEDITEVEVLELFDCTSDGDVITPYGVMTNDDDIMEYMDCFCCGQADDFSCYVYFKEKKIGGNA